MRAARLFDKLALAAKATSVVAVAVAGLQF